MLQGALEVGDLDLRGASYSLEAVRRLSCGRGDGVAVARRRADAIAAARSRDDAIDA